MKPYYLLMIPALSFLLTACDGELEEKASLDVGVVQNEQVGMNDGVVVVKKGNPVTFCFSGSADNISFYSGEPGSQYAYKNRTAVDPSEIASSKLSFSVWAQSGNAKTAANIFKMYISDSFTGLEKNNFKADSVLVENFQWADLVDQTSLPQKPGSANDAVVFDVDLAPYLGKRFAIAIRYQGLDNSAAQSRINFVGMKITNEMKDGTTSVLYAGNFGLTPLNMLCHHDLEDQRGLSKNKEYGTVTNNVSGIWNLVTAGKGDFFIHSSMANKALKYSWLVSDLITPNACSPDVGMAIKNVSQRLDTYTYTYYNTGTYKVAFVATNSNYKHESRVVREINVKVVD